MIHHYSISFFYERQDPNKFKTNRSAFVGNFVWYGKSKICILGNRSGFAENFDWHDKNKIYIKVIKGWRSLKICNLEKTPCLIADEMFKVLI